MRDYNLIQLSTLLFNLQIDLILILIYKMNKHYQIQSFSNLQIASFSN